MQDDTAKIPLDLSDLDVSESPTVQPPTACGPDPKGSQTPAPPDAPPSQATYRNRYILTKLQGRGGMGEVWVCQDAHLGREVALKRMLSAGQGAKE